MKKFLSVFVLFTLILISLPMLLTVNGAGRNNVEITVTLPDSVKIGEAWDGVSPEITVAGTAGRYNLTVSTQETDMVIEENQYGYIRKNNTVFVNFCLYPTVNEGEPIELLPPTQMSFSINGEEIPSDTIMMEEGDNGPYYRFEMCEINIDLSHRTTYAITPDDTQYPCEHYVSLERMATEAEAGATVRLQADFPTKGELVYQPYSVEHYIVNGLALDFGDTFVMPDHDITVGVKTIDKYQGWQYVPEINITLDFEDKDIFYGKKLPTNKDFMDALSISCSVPEANIRIKDALVEIRPDESTGGDMPWAGNLGLVLYFEVDEGYLLANPYLLDYAEDELGNPIVSPFAEWLQENLKITVNGVERGYFFSHDPSVPKNLAYAGGYMTSGYTVSQNIIGLSFDWSLRQELAMDLSGYKAGDAVTIPDSYWIWDGYMPTGYELLYVQDGEDRAEYVYGKSFVMPEADGEVKLLGRGVRGQFDHTGAGDENAPVVLQQSQDSNGHISLDVKDGMFPDITVLQINKLNNEDFGNQGYEILEMVNRVLSDVVNDSVSFEITALSYNQEVQPTKKIIVTFPIPEGFDADYIAFYHVDKGGFYEFVPAEIDRENGVCRAVIDHFSTYSIVSLKDASNLPDHIIHSLTPVPEESASCIRNGHCAYYVCAGCDKWFADEQAQTEITDKDSIYTGYQATGQHVYQNDVCTTCGQPQMQDNEQTTDTETDAETDASDASGDTEQNVPDESDTIGKDVTTQETQDVKQENPSDEESKALGESQTGSGCASAIGGGILLLYVLFGGAAVCLRKRED